jgi:hypothetical protein
MSDDRLRYLAACWRVSNLGPGGAQDGESCVRTAGRAGGTRTCGGAGSRLSPGLSPQGVVWSRPGAHAGAAGTSDEQGVRLRCVPSLGSGAGPSFQGRRGKETFWILVLVDEEHPRRAAAPPAFWGVGVGSDGKRGFLDSGECRAYEPSSRTGRPVWLGAADPPALGCDATSANPLE